MFATAPVVSVSHRRNFYGKRPALDLGESGYLTLEQDGRLVARVADGITVHERVEGHVGYRGLVRYLLATDDDGQGLSLDEVKCDQEFLVEVALQAHASRKYPVASRATSHLRSCAAANRLARSEDFPGRIVAYCVDYVTDTVALERVVAAVHSSGWGDRDRDTYRHDTNAYWAAKVYAHAILFWKGCFIHDPNGLRFLAQYRSDGINKGDLQTIRLYAKQQGVVG